MNDILINTKYFMKEEMIMKKEKILKKLFAKNPNVAAVNPKLINKESKKNKKQKRIES